MGREEDQGPLPTPTSPEFEREGGRRVEVVGKLDQMGGSEELVEEHQEQHVHPRTPEEEQSFGEESLYLSAISSYGAGSAYGEGFSSSILSTIDESSGELGDILSYRIYEEEEGLVQEEGLELSFSEEAIPEEEHVFFALGDATTEDLEDVVPEGDYEDSGSEEVSDDEEEEEQEEEVFPEVDSEDEKDDNTSTTEQGNASSQRDPEEYANERIDLIEALMEPPPPHIDDIHRAWVDRTEAEALELSITFNNSGGINVFELSDLVTESSSGNSLDEAYDGPMEDILSETEPSHSTHSEIPHSIYYLQQFGRLLAFLDWLFQGIWKLWLMLILRSLIKKIHMKEHLANLGSTARRYHSNIKTFVDVCVGTVGLALPQLNTFALWLINKDKPIMGLRGVRATPSKLRLRTPASVLLGTTKDGFLRNMASRARLLRERGAREWK